MSLFNGTDLINLILFFLMYYSNIVSIWFYVYKYVNTLVFLSIFALPWTSFVIYNDNKVHKNSYKLSTGCAINHLSEGETKKKKRKTGVVAALQFVYMYFNKGVYRMNIRRTETLRMHLKMCFYVWISCDINMSFCDKFKRCSPYHT